MNEEEIIKIIKEKVVLDFNCYNPIDKIELEAIQGLLDLYQKEKEKNKELEEGLNNAVSEQTKLTRENTKLRKENHELENADLTTVYMNGFYDGEKKWKDKIKEKQEEFDSKGTHVYIGTRSYGKTTRAVISLVLQELLEERN